MRFFHDARRGLYIYEGDVPGAQKVGDYSVVPATLNNAQQLVQLGYPVGNPLEGYDFPGPYKILAPQVETSAFMLLRPRCFVLSDPRTGKTISTLRATDIAMRDARARDEPFSALILAPKSALYDPWQKHIRTMFDGRRTCRVLVGAADKRRGAFLSSPPADYYVCNFDGLQIVAPDGLPDFVKWVVVDEFTAYKHHTSKRFEHAERCFKGLKYLTLLSGTPTPEHATEAYAPARLIHGLRGESFTSFKSRCMVQVSQFTWLERTEAKDVVVKALQPAIRFSREQVIGLPNKLPVREIAVELSPEQKKLEHALKTQVLELYDKAVITAVHAADLRNKFLQVYAGVVYDADKNAHELNPAPRLAMLRELLDEVDGRAIIFARYTHLITMLQRELHGYHPRVINGAVSAKRRLHVQDEFNARKCGLLICDPQAASHALDLAKGATTAIWYLPVDRNEFYVQGNERIEGVNQAYPTQVVHLHASTLERTLYKRLADKQSAQLGILELLECLN